MPVFRGSFSFDMLFSIVIVLFIVIIFSFSFSSKVSSISSSFESMSSERSLLTIETFALNSCRGIILCENGMAFAAILDYGKIGNLDEGDGLFSSSQISVYDLKSGLLEIEFKGRNFNLSRKICLTRLALRGTEEKLVRLCHSA